MATLVLQSVGTAIGGAVAGPFGAMLGRALGAAAGHAIDQSIISKDQVIDGPRIDGTRILASREGAPIPQTYGRNRIAGQIIWATRFEERSSERSSGGKGGAPTSSTVEFSYYANFAIGICEGPISSLRRVWADGEELDLTQVNFRFYKGNETQFPDPLIEAKQGPGNAPSYRGTAYVVFEDFPLESYGNRIPQITFETVRAVGLMEENIRSVTVIPGSTEHGYDTRLVSTGGEDQVYNAHNRHNSIRETDWEASIDELQDLCPNLEQVALVVSWFGTDLRAGECKVVPGVTNRSFANWRVGNVHRHEAHLVSRIDGTPAYGGTPDDSSVLRAIEDLKSRGLKVMLYPFVMMDIPEENGLPGLYGSDTQNAYPWRGEISCFPGIGEPGTPDKTTNAGEQLARFSQQYENFIQHYISLTTDAGGVDGFLIGSELRGLTRVRDEQGNFPFVSTLVSLATSAKQEIGGECLITYGADWSEYFGYQPQDGSNDVFFNLDRLWASPDIDAVGIDNYMPVSDARNGRDPANTKVYSGHDIDYLKSNIAGGEGYDWYYANRDDRQAGLRTPITDGEGEPWVFRYKDLVSWWSNPHFNRPGGQRSATPTDWQPRSKPIFLTELGCPAVDHGPNQPNVFFDPKSAQSALPNFSSGARDDLTQRRFIEAHQEYWANSANNPVSPHYSGRMVDLGQISLWAWDARPFPWYPLDTKTWADGENWTRGHWLNGRLGGCPLQDLIRAILHDYKIEDIEIKLDGQIDGYVIPVQTSARQALEPLLALFDVQVSDTNGTLKFVQHPYADRVFVGVEDVVQENEEPVAIEHRIAELELPSESVLTHFSVFGNYEETSTKSRRLNGGSDRQVSLSLPAVMPPSMARSLGDFQLRSAWQGRRTKHVTLSSARLDVEIGDIVHFDNDDPGMNWRVESAEFGTARTLKLRSVLADQPLLGASEEYFSFRRGSFAFGKPLVVVMDLPNMRDGDQGRSFLQVAIAAAPWANRYNLFTSTSDSDFQLKKSIGNQATIGKLIEPLHPGPLSRIDFQNTITLAPVSGEYSGAEMINLLNGKNGLAIETQGGDFEVLQFKNARLQEDGIWLLSELLRGQLGTQEEMLRGSHSGARIISLDSGVSPIEVRPADKGRDINWRVGPSRDPVGADSYLGGSTKYQARSERMIAPVHLQGIRSAGEHMTVLSWIRSGRFDADSWENAEIPMDASLERYLVRILNSDAEQVRETEVSQPRFGYPDTHALADLGGATEVYTVAVAQICDTGLPGAFAQIEINS